MGYLKTYWKKCFNTDGRCSRRTFWMTVLINACIIGGLAVIGVGLHVGGASMNTDWVMYTGSALVLSGLAYGVISVIPAVCMGARRLHDRNMTGWLLILIPFPAANIFVLIMFLMGPKDAGNKWGLNSD